MRLAIDVTAQTDMDVLRLIRLGELALQEAERRGLIKEKAPVAGGQSILGRKRY